MKLVVGLGNPGQIYNNTRHNVGFMVLDKIAAKLNSTFLKNAFNGLFFIENITKEKVIFLKPQSYMNLSGDVVRKFADYYKVSFDDILIISDDLDMPLGKIRLRTKGSSGGHNGLKDIFNKLNTTSIKRIKIGIANNKLIDTKEYVLGKFNKQEQEIIDNSIEKAVNVVFEFINQDFNSLMSKYN